MQRPGAVSALWTLETRMLVAACLLLSIANPPLGRYAPNCCNNNFKDSEYVSLIYLCGIFELTIPLFFL